MRAILSGQVGVDKGPYLEKVRSLAHDRGVDLHICHVGRMMYAEAPDVPAGRILNLPIKRLNALRRSVFKEILAIADRHEHVLLNTHATFRWRHGLFAAFDFDQIKAFEADQYVTLVDNVESVHARLLKDHVLDHSLKDIMVWREEEILATEILANILRGHGHYYLLGRGRQQQTSQTLHDILFLPQRRKAYLSFPMSHVMDMPAVLAQIDDFKIKMAALFTCFDPAEVDEIALHQRALKALEEGETQLSIQTDAGEVSLKPADVAAISGDILGQTYARDFKMIDQADLIVSYIPQLPGGRPALSSGVERELQHAFETGKEVYVVWNCAAAPSPFVTETATRLFKTVEEAAAFFGRA